MFSNNDETENTGQVFTVGKEGKGGKEAERGGLKNLEKKITTTTTGFVEN